MIRARDTGGRIVLGLTRKEIEALLEGQVCCFREGYPEPSSRHVCIYGGESNRDVLERIRAAYEHDPRMQAAVSDPLDLRTKPEPGDN